MKRRCSTICPAGLHVNGLKEVQAPRKTRREVLNALTQPFQPQVLADSCLNLLVATLTESIPPQSFTFRALRDADVPVFETQCMHVARIPGMNAPLKDK